LFFSFFFFIHINCCFLEAYITFLNLLLLTKCLIVFVLSYTIPCFCSTKQIDGSILLILLKMINLVQKHSFIHQHVLIYLHSRLWRHMTFLILASPVFWIRHFLLIQLPYFFLISIQKWIRLRTIFILLLVPHRTLLWIKSLFFNRYYLLLIAYLILFSN
jgi:hypothetical protein